MRKEICIPFLFGWKRYLLLHPLIHKMDLLRVHLKEDNMVTTYDYRHRKKENSTILSKYVWYLKENHKNHSFEWKVLEWAKCFNPFTGKCRLFLLEKHFIMFNQKDATLNSRDVIFDICPMQAQGKPSSIQYKDMTSKLQLVFIKKNNQNIQHKIT